MMDDAASSDGEFDRELEVGESKDLTEDGGVRKKLLVAGSGWEMPTSGAEVYVHYTGTLEDGTKFDSSVDRGEPFKFTVGQGAVIKSWDILIPTMKMGEKALLTAKPDYAYGASGSGTIPPNATLTFEVELLRWTSDEDISKSKDGTLLKCTQTHGQDKWKRPRWNSAVVYRILDARYKGSAAVPPFVEVADTQRTITVGCRAPGVLRAVHRAVRNMCAGENAQITIAREGRYMSVWDAVADDWKHVDAPSDLTITLSVDSFDITDTWSLKPGEKITLVESLKGRANDHYGAKQFRSARRTYKKALEIAEAPATLKPDQQTTIDGFRASLALNLAAVGLATRDWALTIESASKLLQPKAADYKTKPSEKSVEVLTRGSLPVIKALMRRARALAESDEWDRADVDYRHAGDCIDQFPSPTESDTAALASLRKDLAAQKERLAAKRRAQDAKDKASYGGMFAGGGGLFGSDDKAPAAAPAPAPAAGA